MYCIHVLHPSFETLASQAPQDEVTGNAFKPPASASEHSLSPEYVLPIVAAGLGDDNDALIS
jgi:hypothetical protein